MLSCVCLIRLGDIAVGSGPVYGLQAFVYLVISTKEFPLILATVLLVLLLCYNQEFDGQQMDCNFMLNFTDTDQILHFIQHLMTCFQADIIVHIVKSSLFTV